MNYRASFAQFRERRTRVHKSCQARRRQAWSTLRRHDGELDGPRARSSVSPISVGSPSARMLLASRAMAVVGVLSRPLDTRRLPRVGKAESLTRSLNAVALCRPAVVDAVAEDFPGLVPAVRAIPSTPYQLLAVTNRLFGSGLPVVGTLADTAAMVLAPLPTPTS